MLFKIDKNLKVDLYNIVLPLGLAVHLRVKSGGGFLFDAKEITK